MAVLGIYGHDAFFKDFEFIHPLLSGWTFYHIVFYGASSTGVIYCLSNIKDGFLAANDKVYAFKCFIPFL